MGQVVWARAAVTNLRKIYAYVAQDSPARAAKLVQRLKEASRPLAYTPRLGRVVPDFRREEFRELVTIKPYRIIYTVRGDDCTVVAVIHGRRDLKSAFDPDQFTES